MSGAIQININVVYTRNIVYVSVSSENEINEIDWHIDDLSPLNKTISVDKKSVILSYHKNQFIDVYPYEISNGTFDYIGSSLPDYIFRRIVFGRYVKEESAIKLGSYLAITGSIVSLGALAYVLLKNEENTNNDA